MSRNNRRPFTSIKYPEPVTVRSAPQNRIRMPRSLVPPPQGRNLLKFVEYLRYSCDNTCTYSIGAAMDSLRAAFSNHTFLFFFAVVGIPVLCVTFRETIKLLIKHRERMAMIEHGMDPDRSEEHTSE